MSGRPITRTFKVPDILGKSVIDFYRTNPQVSLMISHGELVPGILFNQSDSLEIPPMVDTQVSTLPEGSSVVDQYVEAIPDMGVFENGELFLPDYVDSDVGQRMNEGLAANDFEIGRRLHSYHRLLGPGFKRQLKTLTNQSHWIDVGAGLARAMRRYLKTRWVKPERKPQMTAIGIERPSSKWLDRDLEFFAGAFQYLSGRAIEFFDAAEIVAGDLITDIYAAMSYSPRIDVTFQKYIELLKVGGELQVIIPLQDFTAMKRAMHTFKDNHTLSEPKIIDMITIKALDGSEVKPIEWVQSIQGVEILELTETSFIHLDDPYLRVVIRKTGEMVMIPELELTKIKGGSPPIREYRLTGSYITVK